MKKFKLNWKSATVAVLLCAVLIIFVGSQIVQAQEVQPGPGVRARQVLNRAANVNDVYEVTSTMEARLIAMEERLVRMEQKIDLLQKTVKNGFNVVDRTLAGRK